MNTNDAASSCHHSTLGGSGGGGLGLGGHASSTICQSSPGSIGKSSMWRMNGHFANTLKRQQQHQYHQQAAADAAATSGGSPVHYCIREPMVDVGNNLFVNNNNAPATAVADHQLANGFAQSLSMRDFNLITGNGATTTNPLPLLKNHSTRPHQSTTLNLKHYRAGQQQHQHQSDTMCLPRTISNNLRSRLISTTPYDDLIPQNGHHHHHHTLGHHSNGQANLFNDVGCGLEQQNHNNTYQSRLLLAAAAAAAAAAGNSGAANNEPSDHQQTDYGYNIPLGQAEPNYNNIPALDEHQSQQLAETSWTTMAGTNYAIPASANAALVDSIINNNNKLENGPNHFDNHLDCQLNECNNQANINVCIQHILNQEYQQQQQQMQNHHQQQQHYNTLMQQQHQIQNQHQPSKITADQDLNDSSAQRKTILHNNETQITNSVLGSSSGSSSSGIDLGQQSEVGSTSTTTSANNHNNQQFNNINNQPDPNNNTSNTVQEILDRNDSINISRM